LKSSRSCSISRNERIVSTGRFLRIFDALARHDVRFVIVGGMSAVLHRVPVLTEDVDIVHDRSDDNVERLAQALDELDAVYRDDPRRIRPGTSHLAGPGHHLLEIGRVHLDVLGTIDDGLVYADLLPHSVVMEVAGHVLRVLTLEKLIEIKRKLERPKDKFMLLHLEATLDERKKRERQGGGGNL
jgi:predicted nucleotidyltransferase